MAENLPGHHVSVARLRPERGEDLLDPGWLARRCEDVKDGRCGDWKPLVVEGMLRAGPLLVVDGNHRAHAAIQHGPRGLWLGVSPESDMCATPPKPDGRTSHAPEIQHGTLRNSTFFRSLGLRDELDTADQGEPADGGPDAGGSPHRGAAGQDLDAELED